MTFDQILKDNKLNKALDRATLPRPSSRDEYEALLAWEGAHEEVFDRFVRLVWPTVGRAIGTRPIERDWEAHQAWMVADRRVDEVFEQRAAKASVPRHLVVHFRWLSSLFRLESDEEIEYEWSEWREEWSRALAMFVAALVEARDAHQLAQKAA